jgi:hypothetical protein
MRYLKTGATNLTSFAAVVVAALFEAEKSHFLGIK